MSHAPAQPFYCECGDHAFAPTSNGLNVLVSRQDAALLSRRWAVRVGKDGYALVRRNGTVSGKKVTLILGREILGAGAGQIVDHASGDTLDNRRQNLRIATHSQNSWNSAKRKNNKAGVKGVYKSGTTFVAKIKAFGRLHYLGRYSDAAEAHTAYCEAAERLHGEFARAA